MTFYEPYFLDPHNGGPSEAQWNLWDEEFEFDREHLIAMFGGTSLVHKIPKEKITLVDCVELVVTKKPEMTLEDLAERCAKTGLRLCASFARVLRNFNRGIQGPPAHDALEWILSKRRSAPRESKKIEKRTHVSRNSGDAVLRLLAFKARHIRRSYAPFSREFVPVPILEDVSSSESEREQEVISDPTLALVSTWVR